MSAGVPSSVASGRIRVLIVDDSALIRQMFTEILSADPMIEVVGTACDPYDAREKIKQLNPDVITLDIEMPKMDGLSFLEKIMTLRPMPVVMASTLTQKHAAETVRALELGAVDVVGKPVASQTRTTLTEIGAELVSKVKHAARANLRLRQSLPVHGATVRPVTFTSRLPGGGKVIAIGSSTGGVEALREVFLRLPANSPPILVTQHMPRHFTTTFAARLDQLSAVTVTEAHDRQKLEPGHAYVAPGDFHLSLGKGAAGYVCRLTEGPTVSGHRPSVDVLFRSVAEVAGAKAVGVILTGMGKDGADGLMRMREAGAHTIGQNEATCVVYGMPAAARRAGAVVDELSLLDIPAQMLRYCEG